MAYYGVLVIVYLFALLICLQFADIRRRCPVGTKSSRCAANDLRWYGTAVVPPQQQNPQITRVSTLFFYNFHSFAPAHVHLIVYLHLFHLISCSLLQAHILDCRESVSACRKWTSETWIYLFLVIIISWPKLFYISTSWAIKFWSSEFL